MEPKPGQVSYLLLEIFSAKTSFDKLFQDTYYQHLLGLDICWSELFEDIDKLPSPQARHYLRSIEPQYTEDFINHNLFKLNLHEKANYPNLERALFCLGLLHDPYYSWQSFQTNLDELEKLVREHIKTCQLDIDEFIENISEEFYRPGKKLQKQVDEMLSAINYVLYNQVRLRGGPRQLLNIKSHIVQEILAGHKRGIPLSLSCIYMLVGQRLGLPIYGVNLPRHFIVKFEIPGFEVFIDAENDGRLIHKNEISSFLHALKLPYNIGYLDSCNLEVIIRRKIANLLLLYKRKGPNSKVKFLETLNRNLSH